MFLEGRQILDHIAGLLQQSKYVDALPLIDALLGQDPRNPECLFMAGSCRLSMGDSAPAIPLLERALDLGCTNKHCLTNLGNAYRMQQNLSQAALYYELALDRPNADAISFANASTLYVNEGDPQKAVDLCDEALRRDPACSLARFNRSIGLLELGRWEGFGDYHTGSVLHESRAVRNYSLPNRPCPEWDGSSGKTIATWGEQGLGDEIMFASCIPDLQRVSREVVVECDPRLEPLFRRSFCSEYGRAAHVYGTTAEDKTVWPWHHSLDARIAMGGLPQHFRKADGDFPGTPFLKADAWQISRWRERLAALGPEPKVLISWIGGLPKTRVTQRSIELLNWAPIMQLPCKFVSIQWQRDADAEAKAHGVTVFNEACDVVDFTASLMMAADLVISVVNTNVHLAGALGAPCWCLTPANPPWPFATGGDGNLWYNSVRMFRQPAKGDWGSVIHQAAAELQDWMGQREAAE